MQYHEIVQPLTQRLTKLGLAFLQYFEPRKTTISDEHNGAPAEAVSVDCMTLSEPEQKIPDLKTLVGDTETAVAERNWNQADLKAQALRKSYPANRTGWLMGSVALREMRRYNEAEALLREAAGSVKTIKDGLMIGFVSRFSNTDIAVEDWTSICTAAANQWSYSRQHAKAVTAENAWA